MAAALSRIRFAVRTGGVVTDAGGTWVDFDTSIGCVTDWAGLLSEGPIAGDIIEQDWIDGAIWQMGPSKTFSFDVPFTALVTDTLNPNIWESYGTTTGIGLLKTFRGPLLTLRREFYDKLGALARREQAAGVLVTDLSPRIGIGRVISASVVFQNLSGKWTAV